MFVSRNARKERNVCLSHEGFSLRHGERRVKLYFLPVSPAQHPGFL
jgi:hypothetical protein